MAFIRMVDGKPIKLSLKDVEALQNMLKGSLQEHLRYLYDPELKHPGYDDEKFYDVLYQTFWDALWNLPDKIDAEQGNQKDTDVSNFISNFYDSIWSELFKSIDKKNKNYFDFVVEIASGLNKEKYVQLGKTEEETMKEVFRCDYKNRYTSNYPNLEKDIEDDFNSCFDESETLPDKKISYENLVASFHLVDQPMDGIKEIIAYNPNSDSVRVLDEGRHENSTTLSQSVAECQLRWAIGPELEYLRVPDEKGLYPYQKGKYAFSYGTALTRSYSVEWLNKLEKAKQGQTSEGIGFGDLYEAITELNAGLQLYTPEAGKLRGYSVQSGNLLGVGSFVAPSVLYDTLTTIADYMNKINQMKDPLVRKTNAVRLAAFTYQTLLSAHVFQDGNGRTCRLFADAILQTFGLPPHTPSEEEGSIAATIGSGKIDYEKGIKVFLHAVQKSSDVLVSQFEVTKETAEKWVEIYNQLDESYRKLKSARITCPDFYLLVAECRELSKYIYEEQLRSQPLSAKLQKKIREKKVEYANAVRCLAKKASAYKKDKERQLNPVNGVGKGPNQQAVSVYDKMKLKDTNDVLEAISEMKKAPKEIGLEVLRGDCDDKKSTCCDPGGNKFQQYGGTHERIRTSDPSLH